MLLLPMLSFWDIISSYIMNRTQIFTSPFTVWHFPCLLSLSFYLYTNCWHFFVADKMEIDTGNCIAPSSVVYRSFNRPKLVKSSLFSSVYSAFTKRSFKMYVLDLFTVLVLILDVCLFLCRKYKCLVLIIRWMQG